MILHINGGWFNWGTAVAYRNLVGHIAARAQTAAFVPDYRLAPENQFPAGVRDVEACYCGLAALGFRAIALSGDSAGGNLALVLLSLVSKSSSGGMVPAAAVALSPVTDLTLRGSSIRTRAAADPYFTRSQVEGLVRAYLGDAALWRARKGVQRHAPAHRETSQRKSFGAPMQHDVGHLLDGITGAEVDDTAADDIGQTGDLLYPQSLIAE